MFDLAGERFRMLVAKVHQSSPNKSAGHIVYMDGTVGEQRYVADTEKLSQIRWRAKRGSSGASGACGNRLWEKPQWHQNRSVWFGVGVERGIKENLWKR